MTLAPKLGFALAALSLLGLAASRPAAADTTIPVVNGQFQDPATVGGFLQFGVPGFTLSGSGNGGVLNGSEASNPDPQKRYAYTQNLTTLSQILSANFMPGSVYTLSAYSGQEGTFKAPPALFGFMDGTTGAILTSNSFTQTAEGYTQRQSVYTPINSDPIEIYFKDLAVAGSGADVLRVADVTVSAAAPVPEASSFVSLGLLLLLGAGGIAVSRKRKAGATG
ncbi:MAG: hypothetical protein M3Y13_13210 [Armatimonadota bacterium]|nr:hypothetical protein [Armatimonadota bacterium]